MPNLLMQLLAQQLMMPKLLVQLLTQQLMMRDRLSLLRKLMVVVLVLRAFLLVVVQVPWTAVVLATALEVQLAMCA